MPEHIPAFQALWAGTRAYIETGKIATTPELYAEMCHITGEVGQCIKDNKNLLSLEVDDPAWDGEAYIRHYDRMRKEYAEFISEYAHMGSKKTISLNDLTIIAMAKTLGLPVVSGEVTAQPSISKKRIPDICKLENVPHYTFNDFLEKEKIS
jgi:hypothetical protein